MEPISCPHLDFLLAAMVNCCIFYNIVDFFSDVSSVSIRIFLFVPYQLFSSCTMLPISILNCMYPQTKVPFIPQMDVPKLEPRSLTTTYHNPEW